MNQAQVFMLLLLLSSISINAQDITSYSKNNLYAEIGGAGFLSENYERIFFINNTLIITGRVGFGVYPSELGIMGGETKWSGIVPITQSFVLGNKFALEAGYGLSIGWNNTGDAFGKEGIIKWFNGIVGLRYQKPDKGFLFRLGYTPLIWFPAICLDTNCIETSRRADLLHFFGISLGGRLPSK